MKFEECLSHNFDEYCLEDILVGRLSTMLVHTGSWTGCGSAVRFGQALLSFLITAHHLCAFLLYLEG